MSLNCETNSKFVIATRTFAFHQIRKLQKKNKTQKKYLAAVKKDKRKLKFKAKHRTLCIMTFPKD